MQDYDFLKEITDKDIADAITVHIQVERRSLYYGLAYMPDTRAMRNKLQEAMSYVNEGNDFIKGSDWLYCKYVSYGEEYEILWDAPTPSGGDYSIAYYYDEDGIPCVKSKADFVNIVEYRLPTARNLVTGVKNGFQRPLRIFPAAATNVLHPAKVRPSSLSHGAYPFAMTLCGLAACLGSFQVTEQILSVSRQWVLNSNRNGEKD